MKHIVGCRCLFNIKYRARRVWHELYWFMEKEYTEAYGLEKSSITNLLNNVCKVKNSLHGLEKSPRAWFKKFTRVFKRCYYSQSHADHTLFWKHSTREKHAILDVYVDSIKVYEIEKLNMVFELEVKDLGNLKNLSAWKYLGLRKHHSFSTEVNPWFSQRN